MYGKFAGRKTSRFTCKNLTALLPFANLIVFGSRQFPAFEIQIDFFFEIVELGGFTWETGADRQSRLIDSNGPKGKPPHTILGKDKLRRWK